MPTYSLNVALPEPPVPMTVLKYGYPESGDYWHYEDQGKWFRCKDSNVTWTKKHYYFTPAPQPPKSVIGFKKGTHIRRGMMFSWEYQTVVGTWFGIHTVLLSFDVLQNLDPSITSFTTTEDGVSL